MTIEKASVLLDTTNPDTNLSVGPGFVRVFKIACKASSDTSVSMAVTDARSDTIATIGSADYTTRTVFNLAPVETRVFDTAGDASADTEGNELGVLAQGPLTLDTTGLGAGTFLVDVYYEPVDVETLVFTGDVAQTALLGDKVARLFRIDVKSSADTSVALALADANSETVATIASADYTTRTSFNVGPVETRIFDTGGDASADTEHTAVGVIVEGPLTVTPTGIGSGEVAVQLFFYR